RHTRSYGDWSSDVCSSDLGVVLLENGHLLRAGTLGGEERAFGGGPGAGGRVQEFPWDGPLVWDFKFYNDKQLPHHDIAKLPNGKIGRASCRERVYDGGGGG